MNGFLRALSAELLKTKRTLAFWLTLLAPLPIALMLLMIFLQQGEQIGQRDNRWYSLTQNSLVVWGLLMLPLFVTLETGLLSALEHGNKTWKQLYALPLPRWTIYAAKQFVGMGLIGLSMAFLLPMVIGVGILLNRIRPTMGFAAPIPWPTILQAYLFTYLASWLIISLHLWVSAHWPSFVVAMGAGIVTTVAGVLVIESDWAGVYPWTLPGLVAINFIKGDAVMAELALGTVGGIVAALAAGWEVTRRDVL
jgi:lantibiotic transport system permease protein